MKRTPAKRPAAAVTLLSLLAELAAAFEYATRTDGTRYAMVREGAAEWITRKQGDQSDSLMRAVHAALDDRLPDDWVFIAAADIAAKLTDYADESTTLDDLRERVSEIADSQADVYNGDLTAWLASHLGNAALVDDAVAEFGWDKDRGIFGAIAMGQYRALEVIALAILEAVEAELERHE